MNYLVDFLIEKSILSPDVVVKALIEQVRSLPSVAEIVLQESLLPITDIYKVMRFQVEKGLDFRQAALALGYWNDDFDRMVEERIATHRLPLGEILVNNNYLTLTQFTKAVDEYLSRKQAADVKSRPMVPVSKSMTRPESDTQARAAIMEADLEKGEVLNSGGATEINLTEWEDSGLDKLDFDTLQELTFFLNVPKMELLQKHQSNLLASTSSIEIRKVSLHELLVTFHTLLGMVQFAKLKKVESVVQDREKVTIELMKILDSGDEGPINNINWTEFSRKSDVFFKGIESLIQNFIEGKTWNLWLQEYKEVQDFFRLSGGQK